MKANLPSKQKNKNIYILRYLQLAHFGYVLTIPVMVDYVANNMQSGSEGYFFLAALVNCVSILCALFIGAHSDMYSRRKLLIGGAISSSIAWTLFIIFPNPIGFFVGLSLVTLGLLMSNQSVCLYETLQASGNEERYHDEEQKLQAYPQYAFMIALPLASLLYAINPIWPYALNILISIIAIIVAIFYTEAPRDKTKHTTTYAFLKDTLSFIRNTHRIRWLTLYKALALGIVYMIIFVFQAAFLELGGTVQQFALAMVAIYLVRGIGTQQAKRLFKFLPNPTHALTAVLLLCVCFMVLSGLSHSLWIFTILMILYMAVRGLQIPVLSIVFNDVLTSDRRATAFSAASLIMRVWLIPLNLLSALTIIYFGATNALIIIALFLLIAGGGLLVMLRKSYIDSSVA